MLTLAYTIAITQATNIMGDIQANFEEGLPPDKRRSTLTKNRRLFYLSKNGEAYFTGNLADADPVLYDKLIRQYQTAQEREDEVRLKGWAEKIWEDLQNAELKLESAHQGKEIVSDAAFEIDIVDYSKEVAREEWTRIMRLRFLNGEDVSILNLNDEIKNHIKLRIG